MNVAIAFTALAEGSGISEVVAAHANQLYKYDDVSVSILTLSFSHKHLNHGIPVIIPLDIPRGRNYLFTKPFMKPIANIFFKRALEIIRPDVVNVHYPPLDDFVIKNRKKFGYKVVYYYHNITDPNMYAGYERERRILENERMIKNVFEADKVITNSDFTKNYLLSEFSIDSTVITPGIDFQVFRKEEKKLNLHHPALLHIGRIVKHKGIDLLLNSFEQILKKIPEAHLYVIGKSDNDGYSELIRQRAKEIGNVYLLGHLPVEDVMSYYRSADLFTCASIYEGFGMPFMEAQASGLPCVGFNTASIPEVVIDNETGILVKTKDTKAFSEAVIELISDNKKREQFSKKAVEHARNYDWAEIVKKLHAEYGKLNAK